jgi:hypothetical protein
MLVGNAIARIYAGTAVRADVPLEGLVAGHSDSRVAGALACAQPSMAILRRAAAAGFNLILCDAHPFYLYDSLWSTQISKPEVPLQSSVAIAKRAFLDEHRITIVRVRSAWESEMPLAASIAFADQLGLNSVEQRGDHLVCTLPPATVGAWSTALAQRGFGGLRILGQPATPASRVAVKAGMLAPSTLARMLGDPGIDLIVAGDAVEWEATPYMEDAIAAGRRAALVLTGFAASMEPLGAPLAAWARTLFPDLPVAWLSEPDLVRSI